jgi:SAM-dependent methyltransferase
MSSADRASPRATYEPFSNEPIYVEANRAFVARQDLAPVRRFLDLACGTGTVSALLLAASPTAHLNGIDLDPQQIELASERFRALGYEVRRGLDLTSERVSGRPVLTFAAGSADELPFPDGTFDCVTIANAIHLMPDKERFLRAVARVLRPGGRFGFNSAFYAGSMPKGTDRIYMDWLRLAAEDLERLSRERVAQGQAPIVRRRGTTAGAFKARWLSPAEWSTLLEGAGLRPIDQGERVVPLDARCLALVGGYGGMAEVLLTGYPVEEAAGALERAAAEAMALSHAATVPRNYLEIWAVKG